MRVALQATAGLSLLLGTLGEHARADDTVSLTTRFQPQTFQADRDFAAELGNHELNEWRLRRAEICLHVDEQPSNQIENFYAGFRAHVLNAPLVNQLFHDISGSDVTMCHGDADIQDNRQPYYKADHDAAVLPLHPSPGYFLTAAVEEMRHAWQDQHGMITTDDADQSQQAYMAEIFMVEADGATFSVAAAYQLRELGDSRAWDYMTQSRWHGPLAQAFETSLTGAGVTPDNPASNAQMRDAMRASYAAWFETGGFATHYTDFNRNRIAGRSQTTRTAAQEIAVLAERVTGLPTADRADIYLGPAQIALAVTTAFDRFPPPVPNTTRNGPMP